MLLAVDRCLAPLHIETRDLRAGAMRATLADNVHHAVVSMLLAVDRSLAPLHIEVRPLRAQVI